MKLTDSRDIRATPQAVWAAILDAQVLKDCIPGCESMVGSVADGYQAVVKQKIGPVSATFTGIVTLSDIVQGKSVRISGEGKGGVAGYARGGASVTLEPVKGGTRLSYDVDANVGGKIAQLGSRLIDGVARRLADEFFARFQARVEGPVPVEAVAEAAQVEVKKKSWFRRLIGA